jgi:arginase family enzyme
MRRQIHNSHKINLSGTGAPEIGGFTSAEAVRLIQGIAGINLLGCDIVEVLPQYDHADITALLAASIAYEFVSLFALKKKNNALGGVG